MASTVTDRLAGVTAGLASKAPVRMASTGNLTLSGLQTVDGVVGAADDRVLVKDQSTGSENGIYLQKSGAWVRSLDFDGTRDVRSGTFTVVAAGTAGAGTLWRITTADDITIGTTSIAFALMTVDSASAFMTTVLDDGTAAEARTTLGAIATLVEDTTPQLGGPLDTNGKLVQFSEGAAIASASSCDIWAGNDGNTVHITGTTNIDDFATAPKAGAYIWVIFDGVLNVVDSATITVDGNANFTTAANDMGLIYAETTTTFLFKPFPNDGLPAVAGKLVQVVNTQVNASSTGTTTMPVDDSIPQSGEGDEYMTLTITPKNTNNILIIDASGLFKTSSAGNDPFSLALFQDATAGALAGTLIHDIATDTDFQLALRHKMTAGTISATTFKIRAGSSAAGTTTFNSAVHGGVESSNITIWEIAA